MGGRWTIAFSVSRLNHFRVRNGQCVLVAYICGDDGRYTGNNVKGLALWRQSEYDCVEEAVAPEDCIVKAPIVRASFLHYQQVRAGVHDPRVY